MASASIAPAPAMSVLAAPSESELSPAAVTTAAAPLPSISFRPLLAADLPAAHALSLAADWPH